MTIYNANIDLKYGGCGKKGFIPLLRKPFRENETFRSGAFDLLAVLLFLIFEAAPEEKEIRFGTFGYKIKRGGVVRSKVSLAAIFRWNRKTIDKFLKRLVELREISMETKVLREYKKVTIFKVLRYDAYVWQAGARFQDMKTLIGLGGYLAIDREHILSMKEIQKKYCHEWVLFIYLCLVAFHSPTEVELLNEKRRLEKGQVIVEIDRLAALISKDIKMTSVLLKKLARKKLISYQAVRSGKGPKTLIVTVDTYDYFTQNLKKVDNALDNALDEGKDDGEEAGLATSDNVLDNFPENSEKMNGKNTGELPAVVHTPTVTQPDKANDEEAEEEKAELVDEIMAWTYDEQNGFYEHTAPETLREQLAHTVNRLGVQVVRSIFDSVVEGKPWGDFSFDNKCALTELWNRLKAERRKVERPKLRIIPVLEKRYIQIQNPIKEAVFLLERMNDFFNVKLGIEAIIVCLLLDHEYIHYSNFSLGQFKVEYADVLGISRRTMHRIINRLLKLQLLHREELTKRVRLHEVWRYSRKLFYEKFESK